DFYNHDHNHNEHHNNEHDRSGVNDHPDVDAFNLGGSPIASYDNDIVGSGGGDVDVRSPVGDIDHAPTFGADDERSSDFRNHNHVTSCNEHDREIARGDRDGADADNGQCWTCYDIAIDPASGAS
ncbi:MAG: hypothetical protein ACO3II_03860, partial [Ilumatobacteraceae bacterium]